MRWLLLTLPLLLVDALYEGYVAAVIPALCLGVLGVVVRAYFRPLRRLRAAEVGHRTELASLLLAAARSAQGHAVSDDFASERSVDAKSRTALNCMVAPRKNSEGVKKCRMHTPRMVSKCLPSS